MHNEHKSINDCCMGRMREIVRESEGRVYDCPLSVGFMVAARAGDNKSLDKVKQGFMRGFVTKDEYGNALRAYQKRQDELKSDARDEALKFAGNYS